MGAKMEKRIKILIDRIKYWVELYLWEQEKKKEGFPKEWFEDLPSKEYKGNPNFAGDD